MPGWQMDTSWLLGPVLSQLRWLVGASGMSAAAARVHYPVSKRLPAMRAAASALDAKKKRGGSRRSDTAPVHRPRRRFGRACVCQPSPDVCRSVICPGSSPQPPRQPGGYGFVVQVRERNVRVARQARVGKQQDLAVTPVAFHDVAKLTPVVGVFRVSKLPRADERPPPQQLPGRNPR